MNYQNPGDELDQLLSAFYQAELPKPFPALKAPEPRPAAPFRWSVARNKMALAASVGLLLLGGWLLAGQSADFTPSTFPGGKTGEAGKFVPGQTKPVLEKGLKKETGECPGCCK